MIQHGLNERTPGPGRAVRHQLTPKGERLRHAGADIMDSVFAETPATSTLRARRTAPPTSVSPAIAHRQGNRTRICQK